MVQLAALGAMAGLSPEWGVGYQSTFDDR